jgi:hypothetical protein
MHACMLYKCRLVLITLLSLLKRDIPAEKYAYGVLITLLHSHLKNYDRIQITKDQYTNQPMKYQIYEDQITHEKVILESRH